MNHHPSFRLVAPSIRYLLIATLLFLMGTGLLGATNLFPDPVLPAGGYPVSVAAADFNGDGKIDLAAAGWYSQVSILLARGDGEFEPARSFAVTGQCTWIAAGDLNADGKIDLVVTELANGISIFLGGGDGTFVFNARYPAGGGSGFYPESVTVADLNSDGIPDLAVAAWNFDISVLFGRGDGAFQPAAHFPAGRGATSIAVVDFNSDGFPDLAVATAGEAHEAVVLFGHGNGQFDPQLPLGGGDGGYFICTGDFNRDGNADLAITLAAFSGPQVSVLLGDGQGGVGRREIISYPGFGSWLGTFDFDGDGALDLTTGSSVLRGNGDGSFAPPDPSGTFTTAIAIADFDADGWPDLAGVNDSLPGGLVLLFNDGHGHLGVDVYPTVNHAGSVVKGDFNGDGLTDLAAIGRYDAYIALLLGKEDGTFAHESMIPSGSTDPMTAIAAGDFDGDGRLDLGLTFSSASAYVSMYRGVGDGSFLAPVRTVTEIPSTILTTGDFNHDGRDDLVDARDYPAHLEILLGESDGSFEGNHPIGPPLKASAAAVGDFDADGRQDLAVAYPSIESVTILAGNGDGTFETRESYAAGDHLFSLAVGDLNGDGKLDLAAGHANTDISAHGLGLEYCCTALGKVSVLLGQEGGLFAEEVRYDADDAFSLHIADFDHDGNVDIIASISSIVFGAEDGTFGPVQHYAHFGSGVVDDFNHDGWPDAAVARDDIVVALNEGSRDTMAPQISVSFTPDFLWPPNNQLVDITAHIQATDDSGGSVEVTLASIEGGGIAASSNKRGSNVAGAEIGTADFAFSLRAVRGTAKQDAYYLITYTATDAAGNQSTVTRSLPVLHDLADIPRAAGREPHNIKSGLGPPAFTSPKGYGIARPKRQLPAWID